MHEKNFKKELEKFIFHDAEIKAVHINAENKTSHLHSSLKFREFGCEVYLSSIFKETDNQEIMSEGGSYGELKLKFEQASLVEWHHSLLNSNPIDEVKLDYKVEEMFQLEEVRKKQFPEDYKVSSFEQFNNFLGIKFKLCNYKRELEDSWSHLAVFGYNVELEWTQEKKTGQQ